MHSTGGLSVRALQRAPDAGANRFVDGSTAPACCLIAVRGLPHIMVGIAFMLALSQTPCAYAIDPITRQTLTSYGPFDGDYGGDIASDGTRVHLIWQSSSASFHTSQTPGSREWEPPEKLPIPPGSSMPGRSKLVVSDGRLILFSGLYLHRWVRDAAARLAPWQALGPLAQSSDPTFSLADVAASSAGIVLAGTRANDALDVWIGTPDGARFTRKTAMTLSTSGSEWGGTDAPALMVDGRAIHLLWKIYRKEYSPQHRATTAVQSLMHVYSPDFGSTWQQQEIATSAAGLGTGAIAAGKGEWWIVYGGSVFGGSGSGGGLSVRRARAPFGAWNPPTTVAPEAPPATSLAAVSGPAPLLFWSDNRFREREWWGRIPFHQVIVWDESPDWRNNDVFAVLLSAREAQRVIHRLTFPLSYTEKLERVLVAGNVVYVLRRGREKVGHTLEQFGARPDLFVHVLPLEEVK